MSSQKIIRLAKIIEAKYPEVAITKIAATDAKQIQHDIKNNLGSLMDEMFNNAVGVNITLGYEDGWTTWIKGAKIEIKKLVWSEGVTPEQISVFTQKFNSIINYVNKPGLKYEGGPWTFYLPID